MEKYKATSNNYSDDEIYNEEELIDETNENEEIMQEPIVIPQTNDLMNNTNTKSNIASNIHNDFKSKINNLKKTNTENKTNHRPLNRQNETKGVSKNPLNKKFSSFLSGKNKSKGPVSSNITGKLLDKIPPALKLKIYAGLAIIVLSLLIFVTVFAEQDEINLGATNNPNTSSSSSSLVGSRACTDEEIENKIIYLGDSRIVGMKQTINKDNITYIAESGMGYNWLVDTARGELDTLLNENPNQVVVLALGANGLGASNYITYYEELFNAYPDTTFFIMAVNPVDESKTSSNGYTITNSQIEAFNTEIKNAFPDNYIDSYNGVSEYNSGDGVHYDASTYQKIHEYSLNSIKSSNKVLCGTGGGDLIGKLEELGRWYIDNVNTYTCNTGGCGASPFKNCRKNYENPYTHRAYGDDCTEFVAAYMDYVCGSSIPVSYSGGMVDPNGSWAQSVSKCGWKAYSSDEIDSLQPGDVLIAHAGSLYSTKGKHGEVYIDENHTFGWGSIKCNYPTNNTIVKKEYNGHIHFDDGGHDYITIYRYEGTTTSTHSDE